jgi:transposase-like protein
MGDPDQRIPRPEPGYVDPGGYGEMNEGVLRGRPSEDAVAVVHVQLRFVAENAVRSVKTVNEIAQEFGVHPTQVGQWKKDLQSQASSIFDTKRGPKKLDTSADSDRLFAEIGRLKMENDWLKKKSGIGQ